MTTKRLAALMCPSHANLMGNVHGGAILHLLEQAGRVAATAHGRGPTAVVAAERTEFRAPVHVGEVASVDAAVDYVGRRVMRVSMKVRAEDAATGRTRTTNAARMWFSAIDVDHPAAGAGGRARVRAGTRPLPPLEPSRVAPDARREHEASRAEREAAASASPSRARDEGEFPVVLKHLPGPDATAVGPFVSAGHVLKLMDGGAALAAVSHARHQCVTASLDRVCFSTPVQLGDLCTVRAGVTYVSRRSMEVVAQVWTTPSGIVGGLSEDDSSREPVCAVEARFVFVALDGSSGKVLDVPPLPKEKQMTRRWALGAAKHRERVEERKSKLWKSPTGRE